MPSRRPPPSYLDGGLRHFCDVIEFLVARLQL
jgi:hypothetical protein